MASTEIMQLLIYKFALNKVSANTYICLKLLAGILKLANTRGKFLQISRKQTKNPGGKHSKSNSLGKKTKVFVMTEEANFHFGQMMSKGILK